MAVGWIMMLMFWVLVLTGIVAVVRWASALGTADQHVETPTEILRRRYAAGEVSKEQFESMKRLPGHPRAAQIDLDEAGRLVGLV